jgi:hypothetical protein
LRFPNILRGEPFDSEEGVPNYHVGKDVDFRFVSDLTGVSLCGFGMLLPYSLSLSLDFLGIPLTLLPA